MGTRHLICVVLDGDYKIAKYGQWDGYPTEQGVKLVNFLRNELKRDVFVENLRKVQRATKKTSRICGVRAGQLWQMAN